MNKQHIPLRVLVTMITSVLIVGCQGGIDVPQTGVPQEVENSLLEEGYTDIISSDKAEYPGNLESSLGTNRSYVEVWCVFAKKVEAGATRFEPRLVAKKGTLWAVIDPISVPPGDEEGVFDLLGCKYNPPMFREIINAI